MDDALSSTGQFLEDNVLEVGYGSGTSLSGKLPITFLSFLVVTICCFIRFRIPRTKSEIEANAKRQQLLKNFRAKLRDLKAADLDDMDYRRGENVIENQLRHQFIDIL